MENSAERRSIRVIFGRNPPDAFATCNQFPTLTPTLDCPFPGWTAEIIRMIADFAKLEVIPVILDESVGSVNWGYNDNGTWTGVLGMLKAGEADTVCNLYQYMSDHVTSFSYSYPVIGVRDIYITKPKRKSISMSLWNAFFPYEPTVWIILLMALIMQSTLATVVSKLEYVLSLRPVFNPIEKFWQYLRLQIHQTTEFQTPFRLHSGNLSFIFYAVIQATLFTNLYTAVLLSALIQGQEPQPWESYNEMVSLVKAGEYSMVIDKLDYQEGSFLEMLTFTNISHLRNLRDAINKNPVVLTRSIFEALDYVERGGYIFPTKQDSLALQLAKERCDLFYFEDEHMQEPEFFIFSKDNSLLREWNAAIRGVQPFIRRTFQKYFLLGYPTGRVPKCPENSYNIRDASRPLDITSTFGIFLIAMIGFATSFVVFLFELYVDWQALNMRLRMRTRRALLAAPLQILAIVRLFRPSTIDKATIPRRKGTSVRVQSEQETNQFGEHSGVSRAENIDTIPRDPRPEPVPMRRRTGLGGERAHFGPLSYGESRTAF
ncbi:hypothetical protein DdX_15949 [Ditylenchus destructor]|uniref:Uncharacterized protein n=1 Tax=Ditylenchus destructor TaxID=166010 RepID=A0AAD4MPI6_9BILA|nr:hypothetical protein DdX_15949 [Ditylenchus destructor]